MRRSKISPPERVGSHTSCTYSRVTIRPRNPGLSPVFESVSSGVSKNVLGKSVGPGLRGTIRNIRF